LFSTGLFLWNRSTLIIAIIPVLVAEDVTVVNEVTDIRSAKVGANLHARIRPVPLQ